jgi:hypothetical protein
MTDQQSAWQFLQDTANDWFHNPDFLALRACLATAKSLDIETRPVWLMLIAPSSCGKSDFYLPCAAAYVPHFESDDVSIAGLLSGSAANRGKGVLDRMRPKGLWIFSDFTVLLNTAEEKRNAVLGAHRRIYDGDYSREMDGNRVSWTGRVHVVAACTPGLERFHRVNADLGERMIQIRVSKQPASADLIRKVTKQSDHHSQFRREITEAASALLRPNIPARVDLPFEYQQQIYGWAEFVATCRTGVGRNYKDEITSVGHEEGTGRVFQQLIGLAKGDAAVMGQTCVDPTQIPLIQRVAYDCLPWARRAVLLAIPPADTIRKEDLKDLSGISHNYTLDQTLDELLAIGVLKKTGDCGVGSVSYHLADKPRKLLSDSVDSKGVQLTPPQERENIIRR